MEKRKLFLDDTRTPYTRLGFTIVRSFDEFVKHIELYGVPDVVSFDHDLADEHYNDYLSESNWLKHDSDIELRYDEYAEKTGYDAAKFLVNWCENNELKLPECYVHSQNIVGAKNIQCYINNYLYHVEETDAECKLINWYYQNTRV